MSDAAVRPAPQPEIPPPPPPPSAPAPFLGSRARARLRFWAGFFLFVSVVAGASAASTATVSPSPPPFSPRPRPPGRFPGHHPLPRRTQGRPLRADLRTHGPQPPHRLAGPSRQPPSSRARPSSDSIPPAPRKPLMQKEAALRQSQATLDQALAQSRITSEQDKSDLADANYTVERARLEASKQEIVSRLQGEYSKIDLRRRPTETQSPGGHRRSPRHLRPLQNRLPHPPARPGPVRCRYHQSPHRPNGAQVAPSPASSSSLPTIPRAGSTPSPSKSATTSIAGMVLAEIPDLTTLDSWTPKSKRSIAAASPPNSKSRSASIRYPNSPSPPPVGSISLLAEASNECPPTRSFRAYAAISQARSPPAPRHERRHGHHHQPHSQRHQHPGQGALHPRRQAHRLRRRKWPLPPRRSRSARAQSR